MESFFCYEHTRMALRVGDDSRGEEAFYCEVGQHYLFRDGQTRHHINVMPRKVAKGKLEETVVALD
jgi:hypothetical protein